MSVLIWATVLFAVRSGSANTVASETPEITAEAGLCVVIPCYSSARDFSLESAVWHKCEDNCTESDIILVLNNTSPNAQSWFDGRVSLLEPHSSQRNCSIIINDLRESDSGLYQLLIPNRTMAESTTHRANITVKGLNQKPTVTIPPLTEGQQTTLTCTAPGLCSGSDPKITWMWRGAGEKDSHITGNITAVKTENLTGVTQRHNSTLIFNVSAEHHGTNVTCKISFTNNITTEETVTLNVTYVKDPEISGATTVREGDTLNLTCSVDSYPPSVITWTKSDLNKKLNHESGSDLQSDAGTLIIRNVTAEHSGQYICTAKHLDKPLMKEANITVTYVKKLQITGKRTVKKGDTLNLTCSVDSDPPSVITWTKSDLNKNLDNESRTDPQNNTGTTTLVIHNVTAEHSGQYICTAKHLDKPQMKEVNVTVIYMEKAEITGNKTVKEGDTLNLTCNVESSPSTYVVWTQVPSSKRLHEGTGMNLQNNTGTARLVIPNVTAEDTGQYICTAKHLDMTMTVDANVTVILIPKILKSSGCIHQLEVLTCACISQGFPLPTIKWPLLDSHTEYSVITTVSKQTVNSTITLTVKTPNNPVVECVSSNENGEVKRNIIINKAEHKGEGQEKKLLRIMTRLEIIIAFLIGALLSAIICCLVRKCHRKKQRTYGDLAETLEMVTSQENPLIDAGQAVEDYQAIDHDAAEAGGAMGAEKLDVEYSDLDFSLIKTQSPAEAGTTQGTPETEYAEIKKEKVKERQDGEGEEEEKMIGEDEETKHCVPDEEEGEDVALYSTVKDVMDEI